MLILVIFIVFLALLFDFINGMNDAANSVATIVSTRVLSPRAGRALGRLFQFRRRFPFRRACGQYHRQGDHRYQKSFPPP